MVPPEMSPVDRENRTVEHATPRLPPQSNGAALIVRSRARDRGLRRDTAAVLAGGNHHARAVPRPHRRRRSCRRAVSAVTLVMSLSIAIGATGTAVHQRPDVPGTHIR